MFHRKSNCSKIFERRSCPDSLYYLSLKNTNWIPTIYLLKRFNSPDWLERFVGVLIVMRYDTEELCNMRKVIFPRLAASELISDVRDLLEFSISVSRVFFK